MAEFSLEEAYQPSQQGHAFSLDEAYGAAKPKITQIEPARESNAALAVKGTLGTVAGAGAQVMDMFTGILGGIARFPTYVGANTSALLQGADPKLAAQAASIGAEQVLPESVNTPFLSIAKSLGPQAEEYYHKNPIGWINEKISEFITTGSAKGESKTGIPSEHFMQGIDALMTAAGVKGTKVQLLKALKERDAVKAATAAKAAKAEADAVAAQRAEQEAIIRRAQRPAGDIQQQINEVLNIRTPVQRAAEQAAKRKDVKSAFKDPAEGSDYIDIDESLFKADERMRQGLEPEQPDTSTVYDTTKTPEINQRPFLPVEDLSPAQQFREGARILQTPPHERTLADLATLRRLREGGSASPELLGLLTTAGVGATLGAALSDDDLRGAGFGAAAGASAALPFMGRGRGVQQIRGQTGAVKGPGGMWHPEAVERLSSPLKDTIASAQDVLNWQRAEAKRIGITADTWTPEEYYKAGGKDFPADTQADRMINNYLNKHAGTSTDPLKDVEIPFGEGTKRWEELTDAMFHSFEKDFALHGYPELSAKIPENEQVWNLGSKWGTKVGDKAQIAFTSYLSHVGDYLRQNVKPEKLQQYDLVRAVKETAANDARMAKEAAKAAIATTKELPVYKEYPDGYKWVELKLQEKLTEEQAKSIKTVKSEDLPAGATHDSDLLAESTVYVAMDSQGKPIKNTYTQSWAVGKTPEKAYLAGRLAEEGNQMGHCVGGYCEGVASGESKIYSLRGPNGKSHVTVEVEPGFSIDSSRAHTSNAEFRANIAQHLDQTIIRKINSDYAQTNPDISLAEFVIRRYPEIAEQLRQKQSFDISQIKGKQNRAPRAEYLPYVQDFVKSGKWGEVGDLGNTGLYDLRQSKINSTLYKQLAEELYPGQDFLEKVDFERLQNAGMERELLTRRNKQQGSIDQQLVVGLGAVGLGSLIGSQLSEEPGSGALLGALAGTALGFKGGRERLSALAKGADWLGGVLSTRLKNVAPELMYRAREFERVNLQRSHDLLNRTVPWMKAVSQLPAEAAEKLRAAVIANDADSIAQLQKGNPELVAGWREVRNVLTELGKELQGFGRFRSMLNDYYPRLVKDFEGLKAALDQPVRTRLEEALDTAETAAMKSRGTPLTDIEQSAIINKELSTYRRSQGPQPGFAKKRGVEDTTGLEQFYYTPEESLFAYIRGAVTDVEMAKFFGKDLIQTTKEGQAYTNIDQSVGNVVGRLIKEGKLDKDQQRTVEDLLKARFRSGERSPSKLVQEVRNLTNMGLLGNVVSAATQLGDVAMPIYAQGLRSTLTAMARQVSGNRKITAKDFGLSDHLAEEFVGSSKSAEALNKIFKYSGFSAVDRIGKDVMLNAAFDKYSRLSRTEKGQAQIAKKYEPLFGDELPQLYQELAEGRITPRVRALLFSELSDFQPISKLETPQGYLENPNGRIAYMLKTFMIKQFDIVRRDAYNEIKTGDAKSMARGLKNLTAYAITLGVAGASADFVKNWLMGRDAKLEWADVGENVLKTFGWSQYVREQASQSPLKAVGGAVMPPYQMMDQILTADPKAVQYIPLIGKLYYNWELGGREDSELTQATKAKKEGREFELSSRAEDRRLEKREKARLKKEKQQQ